MTRGKIEVSSKQVVDLTDDEIGNRLRCEKDAVAAADGRGKAVEELVIEVRIANLGGRQLR